MGQGSGMGLGTELGSWVQMMKKAELRGCAILSREIRGCH